MNTFTSGVWKKSFWKRFIGPNHIRSPTLLRAVVADVEAPVFLAMSVADDLDVARIADAEARRRARR